MNSTAPQLGRNTPPPRLEPVVFPEQQAGTSAGVAAAPDPSFASDLNEAASCPHSAQLAQGYNRLRFMPALEQEYRAHYWSRYLGRTRMALTGAALLLALFALRDVRTLPREVWEITVSLRLLVIEPAILLGLALTWVKAARPWLEAVIVTGVCIGMGGLSAAILISARMGYPIPYEGLLLVMVFTLFLSGLRFYKASLSILTMVAAYLVAALLLGVTGPQLLQEAYYLLGIVLMGLVGSYSLELSLRGNFLTENIARFRALRDSLTQLYNRRAAMDHLHRAWRLAFRDRQTLAVVLMDVDHFKRFNDLYGHGPGDGCLREVAMALSGRIRRPMDLVARYGGEEFVAVIYAVTQEHLALLCDDVCAAVRDLAIAHMGNPPLERVTISLGAVLLMPAQGRVTLDSALEMADRALYEAKSKGRNQSVLVCD